MFGLKYNVANDTTEEELDKESVRTLNKMFSEQSFYVHWTKASFSEKGRSQWNTI